MAALLAAAATANKPAEEEFRTEIRDGDVTLQGPFAQRFEAMLRNHVLDTDPVYLVQCYHERTETSLWQTEFWGKYMHSAAPFCTMTGCRELHARIDASIDSLLAAQQPDGYLGNYTEARRSAPGTWDVWGIKYTMMGLLHYADMIAAESKSASDPRAAKALASCRRLCDYLIKSVGPGAKTTIAATGNYAGQPSCSVLEPVMWLYNRTKERRYLDFAAFIVKEMTEREDGPRLLDLARKCVPPFSRSTIPSSGIWTGVRTNRGKAYEMMSCYQGLIEYYEVTGRTELLDAALATAADIFAREINLAGSGSAQEHWYEGAVHQHEPLASQQETCVTITWMRLCEKLLTITGDPRWADRFEQTFYNAYLAALSADGRLFAAYTPIDGTRSEGHLHCRMHTNCCNANGPRGFLSFLRSILQAKGDEVFVNYHVSSRASIVVPATGDRVTLETHTLYPKTGEVDIRLRIPRPMKFKLSVRIPATTAGNEMKINSTSVEARYLNGGRYVTHDRTWKPGDVITLKFGLPVKAHELDHHIAFTRGPVLLARDSRFADGDLSEAVRVTVAEARSPRVLDGFNLERSPCPEGIAMVVSARLPLGLHAENPDQRGPATVHFCDYASAGNRWLPSNSYRTWLPLSLTVNETVPKAPRLDRSRFLVGTTGLVDAGFAVKEHHIKEIADCGIDFIGSHPSRQVLDWMSKYGVKCTMGWQLPGDWAWPGGAKRFKSGERWARCDIPMVDTFIDRFVDHPAIAMIATCDEPSALDYDYLGRLVRRVKERFPNQMPFFNLFPNYALPDRDGAATSQLGTKDYERYVAEYVEKIPLDYISFDFYPWAWDVTFRQFYDNFRVVADACAGSRRSLWCYLQCNQYNKKSKTRTYPPMTEATLRYQADVALAYGTECIIWACWAKGWWDANVVDTNGNLTVIYEPLKRINRRLHAISPDYMRFRRVSTDIVGLEGELPSSSSAAFREVRAQDGAALAVGHFVPRAGNGDYAMFVAAIDDPNGTAPKSHVVTFKAPLKGVVLRAVDGDGAVQLSGKDGTWTFPLSSSKGALILAERR